MKNREKFIKVISLFLILVILIICLTLLISYIYKKSNNLNKNIQEKIELINSEYNQFSILVNDFNLKREELILYYEDNVYYEDLYLIKDELYLFYKDYDEVMSKIMNVANSLEVSCKNNFSKDEVNKKCHSYKEAYETVINIFINDINIYNDKVNKYNETVKDNFANLFESKYVNEYVDLNKDSIYLGREI